MRRFILRYVTRYWPLYLGGLVALVVTNYIATVIPLIIKDVIDLLSAENDFSLIHEKLLVIVLLALVLAVARSLSRILIFIPGRNVEYDLRNDLFSKILSLSPSFFREQKIGDLMSRMINDMQSLRATAALGYLHILNTIMIYGFVCMQMVRINWELSLWILLPIPIVMMATKLFIKRMYKAIALCQKSLGAITTFFIETLSSIKVIKSYTAEPALLGIFEKKNNRYFEANVRLAQIRSVLFPFIGVIGNLGQLILLVLGGALIIDQKLSLGEFVALSGYIALLAWPTLSMAWIINIIQRGKAAWERIEGVLNTPSDFLGSKSLESAQAPHIDLKDLCFSYHPDSEPVLKNISLSIEPGHVLGIFGPSGSGKSTLAQLLAGLENSDALFINHHPLSDTAIADYHEHVAYVSQQPFLFSSPIVSNISFNESVTESVEAVTKRAKLSDEVQSFPKGYQTVIGEKGVVLSGGQKSRLALARAFYKGSSLLICDDVLSAVDHDTEKQLVEAIFKEKKAGQTIIIISHRISSLTETDSVILLDKGRITDHDSHENLIKKEGIYKKTWEYQQRYE